MPDIPEHLRSQLVMGAEHRLYKINTSELLSQSIRHHRYEIWQHNLIIREILLLRPTIQEKTHCLLYNIEGNLEWQNVPPVNLSFTEGTYRFLFLSEIKQKAWFAPGNYKIVHLNLSADILDDLESEFGLYFHGVKLQMDEVFSIDSNTRLLLSEILSSANQIKRLSLEARVRDLLLIFGRDLLATIKSVFSVDRVLLNEVAIFVLENLHSDLTIGSLAKQFGTNIVTLSRKFKAVYGMPIHKYIIAERMKAALTLLDLGKSIHDTALLVGYSEPASFSRAFMSFFGYRPSEKKV